MAVPIEVLLVLAGSATGALGAISATSAGIERLGRSTSLFGREIAQLGRSLSFLVTGPIVALAGGAVKAAADFDQAMRRVAGISPEFVALPENFEKAKKVLRELAIEFGVDALKLVDAYRLVNEAGIQGQQSFEVIRVIAKTAAAAFVSANDAAQGIIAVMNAYRESNVTAQQAADFLFRTLDKGVGNFDSLDDAIANVLPTAAALKISLPELSGAISLLTRYGFDWSEATVGLNRMLLDFVKNNQQAQDTAKALGIDLSADALITKGLSGVVEDISTKVGIWNIATESAGDKAKAQAKAISMQTSEIRNNYQAQILALQQQKLALGTTTDQTRALGDQSQAIRDNARAQSDQLQTQIAILTAQKNNLGQTTAQKAAIQEQIDSLRLRIRAITEDTNAQIAGINQQKRGLSATNDATSAVQRQINTLNLQSRQSVLALQQKRTALLETIGTEENYEKTLAKVSEQTGLTITQIRDLFPDIRAFRTFLVLGSDDGKNFANIMKEVGDTTGALDQVFAESSKAFLFGWNQMIETLRVAGIEIGERWLPRLREFIDFLKDLINTFRNLNPETQDWIIKILAMAAAVGPLLLVFGTLIRTLGDSLITFGRIGSAITAINPLFMIFRVGVAGLIPIILGVGAVLILFKSAWDNNWGGIRDTLIVVVGKIHELLDNIIPPELKESFNNLWSDLFGDAQADVAIAIAPVKTQINDLIDEIKTDFEPIRKIWDGVKEQWDKTVNAAANLVNTVWKRITEGLDGVRTTWNTTFPADAIAPINTALQFTETILTRLDTLIKNADFVKMWNDTLAILQQLMPLFIALGILLANTYIITPLLRELAIFFGILNIMLRPLATIITLLLGLSALGPMITLFTTWVGMLGPIATFADLIAAIQLAWGAFMITVAPALGTLILIIAGIAAVIGALALGIMFIKEKWDDFGPMFAYMWEHIVEVFNRLLLPVLKDLWRAMQDLWVTIEPIVIVLLKIVAAIVGLGIISVIFVLFAALIAAMVVLTVIFKVLAITIDIVTATLQKFGGWVNMIVDSISQNLPKAIKDVEDFLKQLEYGFNYRIKEIQLAWTDFWLQFDLTVKGAVSRVNEIWLTFWLGLTRGFWVRRREIELGWSDFWLNLQNGITQKAARINELWTIFLLTFQRGIQTRVREIELAWIDFWFNLQNEIDKVVYRINEIWITFWLNLTRGLWIRRREIELAWTDFWLNLQNEINQRVSRVNEIWTTFLLTFQRGIQTRVREIELAWTDFWFNLQKGIDDNVLKIQKAWDAFLGGVETALGLKTGTIKTAWDTAWAGLKSAVDLLVNGVGTSISEMWKGITDKIETAKTKFTEFLKWISDRVPHSQPDEGPLARPISWSFLWDGLAVPHPVIENLRNQLRMIADMVGETERHLTDLGEAGGAMFQQVRNLLGVGGDIGVQSNVIPNALGKYAIIPYGTTPGPNVPILGYTNTIEPLLTALQALNDRLMTQSMVDLSGISLNVAIDSTPITQAVLATANSNIGDTFKTARERAESGMP